MKKILIFLFILLILSSCSNKSSQLVGNVYVYSDKVLTLTAGFDKDSLFYIYKDSARTLSHKSKYKFKKINDSVFVVELENKHPFWEKNTWEIVIDNGNGIYSTESKKYYKLSRDK